MREILLALRKDKNMWLVRGTKEIVIIWKIYVFFLLVVYYLLGSSLHRVRCDIAVLSRRKDNPSAMLCDVWPMIFEHFSSIISERFPCLSILF